MKEESFDLLLTQPIYSPVQMKGTKVKCEIMKSGNNRSLFQAFRLKNFKGQSVCVFPDKGPDSRLT